MSEFLNEIRNPVNPDENGNTQWLSVKAGSKSALTELKMYAPINLNGFFLYGGTDTDATSIYAPRAVAPSNLAPCASADATFAAIINPAGATPKWSAETIDPQVGVDFNTGVLTAGGDINVDIYWSVRVALNEPLSSDTAAIQQANAEIQNYLHTCQIGVYVNNAFPAGDGSSQTKPVSSFISQYGYTKFSGLVKGLAVLNAQTIRLVGNNVLTPKGTNPIPVNPNDRVKIIVKDAQLIVKRNP